MTLRLSPLFVALLAVTACSDSTPSANVAGLRFVQQPADVKAGQPFQVSVELLDASGEKISGNNSVTLSTANDGSVTGNASVHADAGVATFSGVGVTQVGTAVQLKATSGNASVLSQSFVVTAGTAASAQSTVTPANGTLPAFTGTTLLFTFRDQFGNPLVSVPVSLSASIAGSFLPSSGTTTETGTFTTSFTPSVAGTATLSATVDGTPITLTNTFTVADVCAATAFSFPGSVSGTIPNGTCLINNFPSASHRFTVSNEYVAQFSVTSPFAPVFQVSANPPEQNLALRGASSPFISEWLLPAGTYNARVGAATGSGNYTLSGLVVPNDEGCTLRYLSVAGTYASQQILPNDCNTDQYFDPPDGSLADFYAIQSIRPCTITMRSSVMNSFLLVADWDTFDYIDYDDNSGGGVNGQDAQIVAPVCASGSGPLVIVANHHVAARGPYTLTITFGPAPSPVAALRSNIAAIPSNLAARLTTFRPQHRLRK